MQAIIPIKDYMAEMRHLKKENYILKSRLHAIVRSLPGSIYFKDTHGVYLVANDHALKMVGLRQEEDIIGKTDFDIFTEEEAKAFRKTDIKVMRTQQEISLEETVVAPDGRVLTQLSTKKPLLDDSGKVIGILGNTIDITYLKKIEEDLRAAKEAAEKAQKSEEELKKTKYQLEGAKLISGSIAHEIRTPLATIKSGIDGIEVTFSKLIAINQFAHEKNLQVKTITDKEIARAEKAIKSIGSKVDQSNVIINMLLTKLQSINFEFSEFAVCSASQCIKNAIKEFILPDNMINKLNFKKDNNFQFMGNNTLVMHIIMNLLKNAIFYILKAGHGEITIWLEQHEKYNKIHFKDTGTGISPQVLPHIFDSFFTTESSTGSGVGLAFSKMVMQSHQGKIECLSAEGEYTEFILSFPKLDKKQTGV